MSKLRSGLEIKGLSVTNEPKSIEELISDFTSTRYKRLNKEHEKGYYDEI